jgi:hypothetical protein
MTDAQQLSIDGPNPDGTEDLVMKRVAAQLRAMLGDPEMAAVLATLTELGKRIAEQDNPSSVGAVARDALQLLSDIGSKLPDKSNARDSIAQLLGARKKPPEWVPDTLLRELLQLGFDQAEAFAVHAAASAVVAAFG